MKNNPSTLKTLHTDAKWIQRPPVGNQAAIVIDSPIKTECRPVLTIKNPHTVAETDMLLLLAAPQLAKALQALLAALQEPELERMKQQAEAARQALQAAGRI